jgi:transcriptional regulator with XRE-family HTH domain
MISDKEHKKLIGLRLRGLREKAGLIQSEVAEATNSERASISNYEIGRAIPPSKVLKSLALLFHTTIDYILGKTDDPQLTAKLNQRDTEEKELTEKIFLKLKYTVDIENNFFEYLREDIFKAISDNLYMAYAYHNANDNDFYINHFKKYFGSLDEFTKREHEESTEEFKKAYNFSNVKKVLELTNRERKEIFLSSLQNIIDKYNIKNPDPLANEKEFSNTLFDKIKVLANKHGMDLADPSTLELMDSAFDFIKRMKSK